MSNLFRAFSFIGPILVLAGIVSSQNPGNVAQAATVTSRIRSQFVASKSTGQPAMDLCQSQPHRSVMGDRTNDELKKTLDS